MIARAEVFAYLWFALALNRLAAFVGGGRARDLAWLLPIAVLWANSHASFPLLPGVVLLAAAGSALDAWRSAGFRPAALAASAFSRRTALLGAAALLAILAALANPYGIALVRHVLEPTSPDSMTRFLEEWQPLTAGGALPPRFAVPAILLAGAIFDGGRRMSFVSILLAAALAALALSAERHIAFFGIGAAFALGDYASGLAPGRRVRTAIAAALAVALIGANAFAAAALGFGDRSLTAHPSDGITPRGLAFVREHVRGNVLNSYHLGGALIYFGYPQLRVSIDSTAARRPRSRSPTATASTTSSSSGRPTSDGSRTTSASSTGSASCTRTSSRQCCRGCGDPRRWWANASRLPTLPGCGGSRSASTTARFPR